MQILDKSYDVSVEFGFIKKTYQVQLKPVLFDNVVTIVQRRPKTSKIVGSLSERHRRVSDSGNLTKSLLAHSITQINGAITKMPIKRSKRER